MGKEPGSIAGKEDAGKKEDDANGEGDEGLLGSQPAWCRLDEKGGDGLDHAHRGVKPKRPQHEEEEEVLFSFISFLLKTKAGVISYSFSLAI